MTSNKNAILAVVGCSLAIFWPGALTFGYPGVMTPAWREMFHVGRGAAGMTVFFILAAVGIFMFLVGRWQERYGPRTLIVLGVILTAVASLIAASASSMVMIYAWAFLNGLASCFVYIPAMTMVQRWFPERKGLVAGIVSTVFGLSAAVMSPLFGMMLTSLGYVSMNLSVAALTLAVGLAGAFLARAPEGEPRTREAEPEKAAVDSFTVRESLRTRSFWFLWVTWILAGAAGISMTVLATLYGLSRGFPLKSAIFLLTAFNLTNGASRLISGYASDKFGRNRVMSLAFIGAGLAYFALTRAGGLAACAVLTAVVGFSFGTLFSVSAPLVADCFGLKHFGAIFGLTFTAYGFIAGPLGPALSGFLLDATGDNFDPVFLYLGIFCLLAGFFIRFVVRPRRSGFAEIPPR